jgi:hypothetical protein
MKKNMEAKNIKNKRKVRYYEVPLDNGKFALMEQKEFDKYTVGKPTDAIARASGLIDYIIFEMDGKNYAIPESKFEDYIKKLNEDAKTI